MKDIDEVKRLKRFIYISWTLLLIVILGLTTWASIELKQLNSQIALTSAKTPVVIRAIDGQNGSPGSQGMQGVAGVNGNPGKNGTNGSDGQNITVDQIAAAVSTYLQLNPVPSQQGIKGNDGRQIVLQVDPNTCTLESQYQGDDTWDTIAQLPVPCMVSP